jgi:tetratricopeptide (TPR) repeat protein/predicted Ser/Thr protein kinase
MSDQAAVQDSLIGLEFGHYRILQRVGSGGMGVVYRGCDSHLERDVAIKVLNPGTIADEHSRKRFRNEAHALSKLNHPNIATVFDFHTQDGRDFLVMEFLDGAPLNQKLLEGSLPEKDVITLGTQLAEGLSAAHDHAIVHRDLKPGNLRLTIDGRLKILDFGLAKLRCPSNAAPASETVSESRVIAGTLPYMAPEQVLGGEIDERSDIHAAGTVLYQMATGLPPFTAVDRSELMNEVLRSSPSPANALNSRLSPELARIIGKCLERDPDNRYQSAQELVIDLRRLRSGASSDLQSRLQPARWYLAKRVGLVVVASVLVLFLVLAVTNWRGRVFGGAGAPGIESLAVLPFAVTDGDTETAAFGAGLTETLTAKMTQLTRNPQLQVVPAPDMRAKHISTAEEAQLEFGVNLVLEGSLHKSGNQLRINCILVDPHTRRQIRAESLTVPYGDAFRAEDAVVNSAIDLLGLDTHFKQFGIVENYGTHVASAYDFYLQGRGYLQNYDREENLDKAIQIFQRALALDKNYALAYAGLGEAYWQKYQITKQPEWMKKSQDSCQMANQIDAQLPAAHTCLATLLLRTGKYAEAAVQFSRVLQNEPTSDEAYKGLAHAYEHLGKLQEAESTFKGAIALRPHYWATYNWLGGFYYGQARFHEASDMFRQAVALAPDSVRGYYNLAASSTEEARYDDAIGASERSIAIQPSAYGYTNLGTAYFFLKRYDEAIRAFERAIRYSDNDPLLWWNLGDGYYWAPGRREDSVAAYEKCSALATQELKVNPKDSSMHGVLAICHAMVGQKDAAIEALNQGFHLVADDPFLMFQAALIYNQFEEREETLRWLAKCRAAGYSQVRIRDYPNFESLHSDQRFQKLLRAK